MPRCRSCLSKIILNFTKNIKRFLEKKFVSRSDFFFYCFDFEKKTDDLGGFSVCTGGSRLSVTPMHKLLGASGGFL